MARRKKATNFYVGVLLDYHIDGVQRPPADNPSTPPGAVLTVDRLWNALSDNGGQPGPCGWIKDQFGLLWQIIPRALGRMFSDPDTAAAGRPCRRCSGWAKSTSPNSNAP
jgi:predicted 3-demethylubiquinone-9 3-methyltransferase (glyoxalase superfamily)